MGPCDHLILVDEDSADRHFPLIKSDFRFVQGLAHK
jgi:hypothetical protein